MRAVMKLALFLVALAACGSSSKSSTLSASQCTALVTAGEIQVQDAVSLNLTCTKNSDCYSVVVSLSCSGGCPKRAAVNAGGTDAVKLAASAAETKDCTPFVAGDCSTGAKVECPAIAIAPSCELGSCQI